MQTKRTIIAMMVMMALVLVWTPTINWVGRQLGYDMSPPPPLATEVAPSTTQPSTTQPTTSESSGLVGSGSTISASTTSSAAGMRVASTTQPSRSELGSPAM
ncbi:MAG: hypothetical protein H7Z14_07495, partial [Anaerolineae bacterium]|nr:hypothetical protein [Phycisphaerae bacterium]